MSERIVCDPSELIEGREELSLAELGLEVLEKDADWGESTVEVQLARALIGEQVTDRHQPNVTMTIPLRIRAEGETSLATAAYRLQQKVGLWQAEGGWIRRDFSEEGKFAGSVAYRVHTAALSGIQGWLLRHAQVAPEVTLTVTRSPISYSTTESESATFTEETNRELIWTLENLPGSSPGLIRRKVTNKNASADWRAVVAAMECRDHPQDETAETTAKLAYAATALTRKGGSTEAERESLKVVRNTALTAGWLSILDSEITGTGHMTHKGVRRVWMRVYDPGSEAGNVELKLRWRALGTLNWSENTAVPTPLVGGWALVDLGECRPEPAAVGNDRWEWQLQARAKSGSGSIDVYRVYPLPTEQFMVLRTVTPTLSPEEQSTKFAGKGEDSATTGSVAWTNPENIKASDNERATAVLGAGAGSHFLFAKKFGFALPATATPVGVLVALERSRSGSEVYDDVIRLLKGGAVTGEDKSDGVKAAWPTSDAVKYYGGSEDLWETTLTREDVNAEGFGLAVSAVTAFGGTARIDAISITVYYTEASDEGKICFAARSLELRSDGVFRQHKTDDVWGRLVPESGGFYPYLPPSGLEGRKVRGIIVPSQGDLGELADSGTNKLSETVIYQPGYLFARETT